MIWHYSQQQARHWRESAKSLFTKYTLIQERMIEWKMMTLGWDGMGTSRFQDWWGYWEWGARVGASWNWSSCAIGGVLWCLGLCWLVSLLGFGSVHFPVLWPFSLGAPDTSMGLLGFFPHFMLVFWLLGLCYWLRAPGFSRCMWVLSLFGYLNSGNSGDFDERWGVLTGQFTSLSGLICACVFILD